MTRICKSGEYEATKTAMYVLAAKAERLEASNGDLVVALRAAERFLSGHSYDAQQLAAAIKEIRAALAKATS